MTEHDFRDGPAWLVVGTRPDSSRCVLGSARDEPEAGRLADLFRRHLEGYVRVDVERTGQHTRGVRCGTYRPRAKVR